MCKEAIMYPSHRIIVLPWILPCQKHPCHEDSFTENSVAGLINDVLDFFLLCWFVLSSQKRWEVKFLVTSMPPFRHTEAITLPMCFVGIYFLGSLVSDVQGDASGHWDSLARGVTHMTVASACYH